MNVKSSDQYEAAIIKAIWFGEDGFAEISLEFDWGKHPIFVQLTKLGELIRHVVGVPDVAPFLGAKVLIRRDHMGRIDAIGSLFEL